MSEETTLMTEPATTTTEGDAASQQPDLDATAAQDEGHEAPAGEAPAEGSVEEQPEGAPDEYEFQAPEGQAFDTEVIEQFAEVAKELNLTQDQAQKVLDKMAPAIAQRQAEQVEAVKEQWASEAKADKEYGGDKLPENLSLAKQAMDSFATPELKDLLNETGMGNHPEVIRVFVRVGKAISEDGFVSGRQGAATGKKSFYPNSNMN